MIRCTSDSRRAILFAASAIAAGVAARPLARTRDWMLGVWQSDRERTIEHLHFQGRSVTDEQRRRLGESFGRMRYRIDRTFFVAHDGGAELRVHYRIDSESDNTVTLSFVGDSTPPPLTLYRVDDATLFVRSGDHLEYFRRTD